MREDVGEIFVQMFDVTLAAYYGHEPSLCIFSRTCGRAVAMEHNGDVYSCDHFVEPAYLLGNINRVSLPILIDSDQQRKFGTDKLDSLPDYCRACEVRFACNGGCPKDRFIRTPTGERGLNYLCKAYRRFFNHVRQPMRIMAELLRRRLPAADVMRILAAQ